MTEKGFGLTVALVLANDKDEVCLMLRKNKMGGMGGLWMLPGGKVDHGEPLHNAIHREILEELGIQAFPFEIWSVNRFIGPTTGRDYTCFGYFRRLQSDEHPTIMEPDKFDDVTFWNPDDLPPNIHPIAIEMIGSVLKRCKGWMLPPPQPGYRIHIAELLDT